MLEPNIFQLSQEELELTTRLKDKIIAYTANHGTQIPFSKYMELALYDSDYGYYTNLLHKFGRQGDFITAPLISGLFAACIARQLQELWEINGECKKILEIGAGNGQLMLDLFSELGEGIEAYYILELSPNLIQVQRQKLDEQFPQFRDRVVWLDTLPDAFKGTVLANELLDAQPCEVVVWSDGEVKQQMVGVDPNNNLRYITSDINSSELLTIAQSLSIQRETYTSEINLNNRGFMKALAEMLDTGYIIFIDYGYAASEYYAPEKNRGTLRGFFRQHQLDDVLFSPGLIDITANVDFTCIATTGIENNLDLIGYTTQANFLLNCGLLEIIASKRDGLPNNAELYKLHNQLNYLTSPNEMGNIFKVIGFSKNIDFADWAGFKYNDRTHTL